MPWIPVKSADKLVYGQVTKLEKGKKLRVESFKGDRWLEITKIDENTFEINEHGFNNNVYKTNLKELKKLLKELIEEEFPRSHQLRVSITS
ncbi:hypothetical protein SJAV_06000 [Sulfurisphaera javensis]|uniref:Uncharacterized protein n=1 Tax=Sulfurisphaera javensis TaxID=2049879 RepID=A0AAT9GPD6_9CREN